MNALFNNKTESKNKLQELKALKQEMLRLPVKGLTTEQFKEELNGLKAKLYALNTKDNVSKPVRKPGSGGMFTSN